MPSLSTYNCFEILTNIHDPETNLSDVQKLKEALTPPPLPMLIPVIPKIQKLKWEKALPEKHTNSAIGEFNSLQLKVKLKTMDTSERKCVNSLVDSGATGDFINQEYVKSCQFNLLKLTHPIPVYNIDRSCQRTLCRYLYTLTNSFSPPSSMVYEWALVAMRMSLSTAPMCVSR